MNSLRLETSRLIIRPPIETDLDGWAAFDGDERATEFFGGPKSRATSREFLATAAGMWLWGGVEGCKWDESNLWHLRLTGNDSPF